MGREQLLLRIMKYYKYDSFVSNDSLVYTKFGTDRVLEIKESAKYYRPTCSDFLMTKFIIYKRIPPRKPGTKLIFRTFFVFFFF